MNISNYNHLFYFYITAKLGGVTVAAKHLNTSQSSLSIQIKALENSLERSLFRKAGRKMELTESGRELYNYCRRAFEVFDEMFDHIDQKKTSMGVRVSIGVAVDIERPFVTESLAKITKVYSRDKRPLINLISLPSSQLVQLLRIGEIDLLLTTNSGVDHELQTLKELSFPVGIFAAKDFPLKMSSRGQELLLQDSNMAFALPSKQTTLRAEIDGFFSRRKIRPVCVFESNIISAVVRAGTDKIGAIILPEAYVDRELRSEKLIPVSRRVLWNHRISLLALRGKMDEGRREFAERLVAQLAEKSENASFLN